MDSKHAKSSQIRLVIDKRIENFELNKGQTIRSVLKQLFCKVTLDHLIVNENLILEPGLVKFHVNSIMKGWTKKRVVINNISDKWLHQFQLLKHVFDNVFSNVMHPIEVDEFLGVALNLPYNKAAGLSGITNKLWKHCDKSVLDLLLNSCLICESVLALIETAHKILSKILSNRIFVACSKYDVLCNNNFSVFKGTMIQSSIFAIGSVVKDALEKNYMRKAYDLVGWEHLRKSLVRIKMCSRFIKFFGSIYNSHMNRMMTDFGLTNGYSIHDGLNQKEVFSPFLWCIFYDTLLCKVKRQEAVCGYRMNSYYVAKTVGSSQTATQHILNVASEFFKMNNILINTDKTVVILINCRVAALFLFVSSAPISITKKDVSHQYLGIFFSSDKLFKPSLAKAHLDFSYLVLVVLYLIVDYRNQFSFISASVCQKWDVLIWKGLKLKLGLPLNFLNNILYYSSFYGLKTFKQVQAEGKVVAVVCFTNSVGILDQLFTHRSHDLQVLSWCPVYSLCSPVYISVNFLNNFLVGVVWVFLGSGLSLELFCLVSLVSQCISSAFPSFIIMELLLLSSFGARMWKKLDPCGSVPVWLLLPFGISMILFRSVCDWLSGIGASGFSVYTDGFFCSLGSVNMKAGAAAFFKNINIGLGMEMTNIVSSTLVELQAIVLALECVLSSSLVCLFSDSQAVLDACQLLLPGSRNVLFWLIAVLFLETLDTLFMIFFGLSIVHAGN
ncbi:hypothetical protein G9A89_019916 [Geosiphon pyriformis]|nr:hypothetical protein G9A89_019916 [Geosiphon pyriformis]